MSRNGSYAKSMNGIVSFDDGDGTTIEGSTIETTNIICDTVNSNSINVDYISSYANGYVQCLQAVTFNGEVSTNTVPVNNSSLCNKLYVDSVATSGTSILPLNNTFTGNNTFSGNTTFSGTTTLTSSLSSNSTGTFSTSVKGGSITLSGNKIELDVASGGVFIFKNNTGDIVIGNAVSSAVNIGSYIKVMLGDIMADTYGTPYTGGGNYSLFNNLVTGLLRIGQSITTGNILIGQSITTGAINIGGNASTGDIRIGYESLIRLTRNLFLTIDSIYSGSTNDIMNLFSNLTTGALRIANGLTTGTVYIADTASLTTVLLICVLLLFLKLINFYLLVLLML